TLSKPPFRKRGFARGIQRGESKSEPQAELDDARLGRRGDLAKQAAVRVQAGGGWVVELSPVKQVKELGAEFQLHPLAHQRRGLGDGKVHVGPAGTTEEVSR